LIMQSPVNLIPKLHSLLKLDSFPLCVTLRVLDIKKNTPFKKIMWRNRNFHNYRGPWPPITKNLSVYILK
jgi:hypothetical protein